MGDEDRKGDKGRGAGLSPGESVWTEVAEFSNDQMRAIATVVRGIVEDILRDGAERRPTTSELGIIIITHSTRDLGR